MDNVLSTKCLMSLSKLYFCFLELCGGILGGGGGGRGEKICVKYFYKWSLGTSCHSYSPLTFINEKKNGWGKREMAPGEVGFSG